MVLSIEVLPRLPEAALFMSTAKRAYFQTIVPALIKNIHPVSVLFLAKVMIDNTVFKLV